MSALPITITTAGLQALINAQNTGVSNVVIDKLGVSAQHTPITAATTTIPAEIKRLAGVSGLVTAEDTIYISAADQTQDTYTVRTVALYLTDGTLFAAYSQATPLVEKAAPSQAVLEASIKFLAPMAEVIEFTGGGWVNPSASETVAGVLRLASVDETIAGVSHSKAVTPKGLKAVTNAMMAAITGALDALNNALAGKANTGHSHHAGDVNAGTFNEARIPELPQSRIAGLINALSGKADTVHGHTTAQISGLTDALATKAAVQHTHDAADVDRGTFNVGRIPSLAMEKITGLANALAAKASLDTAVRFDNVTLGRGNAMVYPNGDDVFVRAGPSAASKFFGFDSNGNFSAHSGLVYSRHGRVWDPQNFNPADKANALHSHDWSQITGKGDVVLSSATGLGRLNAGPLHTFSSLADIVSKPTGYSAMMTNGSAGMPPYLGYFFKMATRDAGYGWQGLFSTFVGTGEQTDLYVGSADQGHHTPVWSKLISEANFRTLPLATPAASGLTLLADNWQTKAGQDAFRAVTPASLWSFAKFIGPSGYVQIPGTDLIIQWGVSTASVTEGLQHATLPVAFGGGCLVALANARNPSAVVQYDWYMQVHSKWLDRIIFYANKANDSSPSMQGFEWIAIGLAKGSPNPAYSGGSGGGGLPPGGGGGGGEYTPEV